MAKPITFWATNETLEQIQEIKQLIKEKELELPDIAKIPALKGILNISMVMRFCIRTTLKVIEKDAKV